MAPYCSFLYVNDLPQSVQNSSVRQYADDTTMTVLAKDVNTLRKSLEEDADNVMKWADSNVLKLNAKKTQLLLLGRKRMKSELAQVRVSIGAHA